MGLDKNSLIGISLICAIMFAWMWYSAPSKNELQKQKHTKDSLQLVEKQNEKSSSVSNNNIAVTESKSTNVAASATDSAKTAELANKFDVFAGAATDSQAFFTLENKHLSATISKKGGRICSVRLKNYKTYSGDSLILFDNDSSSFGLLFDTEKNRTINTNDLFFDFVAGANSQSLSMRLYANSDSSGKSNQYIEYGYSLAADEYMLKCKLTLVGMENIIAKNSEALDLRWTLKTLSQERDLTNQRNASTAYFKYVEAEPDYINETKYETKLLDAKVKWVAFKQQFFSTVLIADNFFDKSGAEVTTQQEKGSAKYVKSFTTSLSVPYDHKSNESFGMQFYFGPNHFETLKKYDLSLEKQIPLGWGIFGWVNKFLVIPVFSFLNSFNLNYGIIILCLTLVFKTLLFPVAYKTYTSSAKMRVLKPELDELNEKFGTNDPMKKQQATMALYKKAGVNPLAGCIPALLQMPILLALFRFFPASIELRQQGFWWATDLSTYDSVWNFGKLPIIDFIYGDHVSVWALLCTITTLIYTHLNSQLMSNPGQQQMAGMKYMMYIMPLMFLPFLNKFSAGLSYYYTLANIISFVQMFVIRKFVDENKLRAIIDENKKKPAKAVSSFQQKLQKRLEDAQRQRNGSLKGK